MTERFRNPVIKYTSDVLRTLPGAKLYFYQNGTSTPKEVYADKNKVTSLGAIVTASPEGIFEPIFLDGTYRVELKNAAGVTQTGWPVDNVGGEDTQGQFDDWSSITVYSEGDIVTASNGLRYVAIYNASQNLNQEPSVSPLFWDELRLTLEYDSVSSFSIGDRVFYGGNVYVSLQNSNAGHTPSSTSAYWKLLDEEFVWNPNITYGATAIVKYNGIRYHSQQGSNLNNDPSTSQNYWLEEKLHYKWNSGHTYGSGDYVYEGELRYKSQQSSNTGNQPSTDTAYTWWKPASRIDLEANPQLLQIKSLTGGGNLSAEWINAPTDSGTYYLPPANSVPANTVLMVSKLERYRTNTPVVQRSGSDTITANSGSDTALTFDYPYKTDILFTTNGSNTWSI